MIHPLIEDKSYEVEHELASWAGVGEVGRLKIVIDIVTHSVKFRVLYIKNKIIKEDKEFKLINEAIKFYNEIYDR